MIKTKRVYEFPAADDGYRVLVDRLWPRGISRETAAIDAWRKEIAPSNELRRWFGKDETKWPEFVERYRAELTTPGIALVLADIRARGKKGTVTLLYAKRNEAENNAAVLRDVLLSSA